MNKRRKKSGQGDRSLTAESAFEKRVKRRIVGRPQRFFAITQPGLEEICAAEIDQQIETPLETTVTTGGVLFTGKLHDGYEANLKLRTASRVLMRIDQFQASNFHQLEKSLQAIDWDLYLPKACAVRAHAASSSSRLYHSDALRSRLLQAIEMKMGSSSVSPAENKTDPTAMDVYIRLEQDRALLSIDSSGDLLHRRGVKTTSFRAPIRETTAAAILTLAGYDGSQVLVDPMCGSGTFSLEAALMAKNVPPGWHRRFAFMHWPSFRVARWRHLRRQARKGLRNLDSPMVFSSDKNAELCRSLEKACTAADLLDAVRVRPMDFFELTGSDFGKKKGLLVINPPYGKRMGSIQSSKKLVLKIGIHLKTGFRGWHTAVIIPSKKMAASLPAGLRSHSFFHGGMRMVLLTGIIR
jgi:putative N6-adenine-specific DNA methylase